MELLIVTGISGAGKSLVVSILEDIGFFCVDNLPGKMLSKLIELCNISTEKGGEIPRVAVGIDVRSQRFGGVGNDLYDELQWLDSHQVPYKILFMDCENSVLVRRFQEQRRIHPLIGNGIVSVEQAISVERSLLEDVRSRANYVIDTSETSVSQLKEKIHRLFLEDMRESMLVNCMSFGFKNGMPREADLVFDVRCLPNPHYIPELKPRTGREKAVQDYVMDSDESRMMLQKIQDMVASFLPLYQKEGKTQLTIAFGCTGGKHRSVTFAELMKPFVASLGYPVVVEHRDSKI